MFIWSYFWEFATIMVWLNKSLWKPRYLRIHEPGRICFKQFQLFAIRSVITNCSIYSNYTDCGQSNVSMCSTRSISTSNKKYTNFKYSKPKSKPTQRSIRYPQKQGVQFVIHKRDWMATVQFVTRQFSSKKPFYYAQIGVPRFTKKDYENVQQNGT